MNCVPLKQNSVIPWIDKVLKYVRICEGTYMKTLIKDNVHFQ